MRRRRLERLPGKQPIFKQSPAAATTDLPPYVQMRRFAAILATLALAVVLVVGLTQAGGDGDALLAHEDLLAQRERGGELLLVARPADLDRHQDR